MNRRIDEELFERNFNNETHSDPSEIDENNNSLHSITSGIGMGNSGEKIRIYACATVWHETGLLNCLIIHFQRFKLLPFYSRRTSANA